MNNISNSIIPTKVLEINNILRSLGFNTSIKGTKFLNKVIQYIIKNDIEFFTLDNIYNELSKIYNIQPGTIKWNINYALNNRNEILTKKNFYRIFNFNCDEIYFEPKIFIQEIIRIIK